MLCAIYCRLSKEDQEKQQLESESIQNQKSMLLQYALERGWEVYDLYCDEDYSGVDDGRPDFNRMLHDAEEKRFQIILCKTQSRFTRDMELVERYIHGKFLLWGIRFVAIADNVDTEVKGNKKARQINGLINEWYLEDLSENIRMVLDYKRRQGQYIGGFPIYGYRKDPRDKNKLIIDEETAPVVRRIYQWYLEGWGVRRITQLLNQGGYDTPSKRKANRETDFTNGCGCREYGIWNKTTVGRILHNEMYTGVMVQGRKRKISYKSKVSVPVPQSEWVRVEGTHAAIIDAETFQRVQELMQPRVKTDGLGEVHPLGGLVRCMDCGSTMTKTSNRRNGEVQVSYLRCKLSATGAGNAACSRHSVRLDRLVPLVEQRLREHIGECCKAGAWKGFEGKKTENNRDALLRKELHIVQSEIEKRSVALKNLYLDKTAGIISGEQFCSMNGDFLREKVCLEERREELKRRVEAEKAEDSGLRMEEKLQGITKFDPIPRELYVMTIEYIEIGEKNRETGEQAVHIIWKF